MIKMARLRRQVREETLKITNHKTLEEVQVPKNNKNKQILVVIFLQGKIEPKRKSC